MQTNNQIYMQTHMQTNKQTDMSTYSAAINTSKASIQKSARLEIMTEAHQCHHEACKMRIFDETGIKAPRRRLRGVWMAILES